MKVLVVRFSSIGDVVLTTPIVRALKNQIPNAEVHFITKKSFKGVLEHNPHIEKLFTIEKSISEVIADLKKEKYDYVIDLHRNTRTLALKLKLGVKSFSFPKKNVGKWILVNFKKNILPEKHVVDRYFEAIEKLGVKNDYQACDFYIHPNDEADTEKLFSLASKTYISIAIGAQFATKRIPFIKLSEIIQKIDDPIILVGGSTDLKLANEILKAFPDKKIFSACGNFNLAQSASIVKQSKVLLTNDTGMMHIATCFQIPIVSVWGNTVPAFGMYPYYPKQKELFAIHEVLGLSCRPCSKIGFQKCPKGHFKCMLQQDAIEIAKSIKQKSIL